LHYRDAYGLQLNYWPALHSNCRVDSFRLSHEIGSAIWATYGAELRYPFSLECSMLNESASAVRP